MSIFKKKLKIGQRVTVIAFSFNMNRDELKTGKIIATKRPLGIPDEKPYAVRFDDGKIGLFRAEDLFTEWEEE